MSAPMNELSAVTAAPRRPNFSLSKDKIRVLLLEGISDRAAALFDAAGYTQVRRLPKALDGAALAEALEGVHILGIRSRTQMTAPVFAATNRLMLVGCFSVGTNQVDLEAARGLGIPVFNAPFSNTRSVAELVIGEIVMLLRRITSRSEGAHAGRWDKSAERSYEVRGKTLGIVGYGSIGSQLSTLAEGMGMRVIYFDVTDKLRHGNTEPAPSLHELLASSDVVSLHVPETASTAGMIGAAEIAAMRRGSYLINNSRGTVVDLDALADALRREHLFGASVDVFPVEPAGAAEPFRSPLQGLPNVILSPHIGGSTVEAQERIGEEVAAKLIEYSDAGSTLGAVNFPQVQLPRRPAATRYIHIHHNVPGMLGRVNSVFSSRGLNIAGQFLQTDGDLGYVVMETQTDQGCDIVLSELRQLDGTIRARLIRRS
jgi:D-3-phosphoglycerate dehydrogenase / 2-oxoglutarate reductase